MTGMRAAAAALELKPVANAPDPEEADVLLDYTTAVGGSQSLARFSDHEHAYRGRIVSRDALHDSFTGEDDEGSHGQSDLSDYDEFKDNVGLADPDPQSDGSASNDDSAIPVNPSVSDTVNRILKEDHVASNLMQRPRAEEQAQSARAVLSQRSAVDAALQLRIILQRALRAANRMPAPSRIGLFHETCQPELDSLSATLRESLNGLFELQNALARRGSIVREVKKLCNIEDTMKYWHNELCGRARAPVLERWTRRTVAASGLKALQQTPLQQIELQLAVLPMLKHRAQRVRIDVSQLGLSVDELAGDFDDKKYDEQAYDDSEFYAQLLRDVVSRGTVNADATSEIAATSARKKRTRRDRRAVDPRASKGRRLRYEVMPKLVSFAAPRTEEASSFSAWREPHVVDELFRGLFATA